MNEKNNLEITEKDKGNKNKKIIIGIISVIAIVIVSVLFFMTNRKEGFRGTYWNDNEQKFEEKYNESLNLKSNDLEQLYSGLDVLNLKNTDFYKPNGNGIYFSNEGDLEYIVHSFDSKAGKNKVDYVEETYTMKEDILNDYNSALEETEQLAQYISLNGIYDSIIKALDKNNIEMIDYKIISSDDPIGFRAYKTNNGYVKIILSFDEYDEDSQYIRIEYINPKYTENDVMECNYQ